MFLKKKILYITIITANLLIISCTPQNKTTSTPFSKADFISDLKIRTFNYFWDLADSITFQTPDRYPTESFTSIAATGFGLTAYIIGIENNYISRQQGAERVLKTLEWLAKSKQGNQATNVSGYKGFYYHFLTNGEGKRYKKVELSTIDTGLLMAGILSCMSFFDQDNTIENKIRELSDNLYKRVDWKWAMNNSEWMSMGWKPEEGFLKSEWKGYNEAMILVVMALGSPTHPIQNSAWQSWCKDYKWEKFQNIEYINFEPLFGHQYSHMYIDFRGIKDNYMQKKGIDYFENSRRATLANRAHCIENSSKFADYSDSIWGLTACDGPENDINNGVCTPINPKDSIKYFSYRARGASAFKIIDDGTIAPTAAGGSYSFAPEIVQNTLYSMYQKYNSNIYKQYGFIDAFNMTLKNTKSGEIGWFDKDYLGIDQGPILIQIENAETGLIWNIMKKNPYIIQGLKKAGFKGAWLNDIK